MIYFVRHGQTINNIEDVFYDQTLGPELTEKGIAQAQDVANKLKDLHFDVCYCAPRLRTIQTMKIVAQFHPDLKVVYDERLAERKWGECVGKHVSVCEPNRWYRYKQFPYKGIESVDEVFARIKSFYDELDDKDKNILVVSHSGIYKVTYCYFHGFPENNDLGSLKLENGDVAIFKKQA